ncbi:putative ammonium transporter 2 isoform X2 [Toxorhynchites rutilus septentrionalis]|uniref:putative ammonium transporter 2 isoform X2 n=1 Tax=Toxorhynchites rutilus septentrionalis TaxID=329112 RepID=UPI00247A9183|nr:putative ammonium transporter 2 isoform X2 [Toxorhynchites rutilus septentrionalis]
MAMINVLANITANDTNGFVPKLYDFGENDGVFIMLCAFLLVTLQTGFALIESGCVSAKSEVDMMIRNVVDIVLGGISFWIFGYAFMLGISSHTNPFIGLGDFLVDSSLNNPLMGQIMAVYLFQMTFSASATTIVGGAIAERCNFKAYCLFSFLNTIVYCIPAGWVWGEHGFLNKLGVVDIAGSGPVHLVGGSSAFASAMMLGPRLGRYAKGIEPLPLGNPVNACMGLFVLWWGWLAFNSGSTYGVSGAKWIYAARAAVMTMMGSFGGGSFSIIYSMIRNEGRLDIVDLINGILGSLVSVTAGCFLYHAWEAILIGAIGSALCCLSMPLFDKMGVDDPVGASAVHGVCGVWGVLAVGLFADNPIPLETTGGRSGLLKGGGWYLLGVQSLSALCLACWSICTTFALLWIINKIVPIRMDPNEELLGADLMEHRIRHSQIGISRALSALAPIKVDLDDVITADPIGRNPGHDQCVDEIRAAGKKLYEWRNFMDTMSLQKHSKGIDAKKDSFQMKNVEQKTVETSNNYSAVNFGFEGKSKEIVAGGSGAGGLFSISNDSTVIPPGKSDQNFAWID